MWILLTKFAINFLTLLVLSFVTSYAIFSFYGIAWLSWLSGIFVFLLTSKLVFGGNNKVRREQVDKFVSQGLKKLTPSAEINEEEWAFAMGYLNSVSTTLFYFVCHKGLWISFVCYQKDKPVLVPWGKVLALEAINIKRTSYLKITIDGDIALYLPSDKNILAFFESNKIN